MLAVCRFTDFTVNFTQNRIVIESSVMSLFMPVLESGIDVYIPQALKQYLTLNQ